MGITHSPLPRNQVKLPLSHSEGNLMIIFHDLLDKITIKTVQLLPFPHIDGKLTYFSLNYRILCFQKDVQNYLFPYTLPEQFIKNR